MFNKSLSNCYRRTSACQQLIILQKQNLSLDLNMRTVLPLSWKFHSGIFRCLCSGHLALNSHNWISEAWPLEATSIISCVNRPWYFQMHRAVFGLSTITGAICLLQPHPKRPNESSNLSDDVSVKHVVLKYIPIVGTLAPWVCNSHVFAPCTMG